MFAGNEFQHVQPANDLGSIDPAPVPVGRPETAENPVIGINWTAIEKGDFDRSCRVREVDDGNAALVPGLHEDVAAGNWDDRAVMGDAILLVDLRRRHLEITAELELAVDDVVDGSAAACRRPTRP